MRGSGRSWVLVGGLVLGGSCATPSLHVLGRGGCGDADPEHPVLFCDGRGRLVTCSGGSPIPAAKDIQACVTLEGAPYLVTCDAGDGPGHPELVPCPACATGDDGGPSFVTLPVDACLVDDGAPRPPAPPPDDEPLDDEPLDEPAIDDEAADDEPLDEGEEGEAWEGEFDASALYGPLPCDVWAEEPCPEGHVCRLDVDPPVCEPGEDAPARDDTLSSE